MTTFAVTVTYGNRFHLVKQVIDGALREGLSKVIVVDNNSAPQSREQLKAYEQELGSDKIKVLYLVDNYGSAGGFKRGLEEAYNDPECEFIWLLDDDNVPQENSLKNLAKTLECFNNDKVVLVSYRKILDPLSKQILDKNSLYQNVSTGEFLGQDKTFLEKMISKFSQKDNDKKEINFPVARRRHASYGGLFINKKIIEKIGYPNEAFYLYADDTEYSQRMENNQYVIYTCFLVK
ncbi:MAG: glycosyltransferase [Elusimicrobiota bacterium]